MSDSVLTGTNSGDTINGSGGSNTINSGAGNDTIDGGGGDDRLNAGSGADTLVYRLSQNLSLAGTTDLYTGGSGVDIVQFVFTREEWASQAVQDQINAYTHHLQAVTHSKTGEVSNASASDFTFHFELGGKSSTLTVSMIENVEWVVQPTVSAENVSGAGDDPISLAIAAGLTAPDGSDNLTITISGVPDGWTLSAGVPVDGQPGTYSLSPGQLAGLEITPPPGTAESIALTVTATATESTTGTTTSTSMTFLVSVSQTDAVQGQVIDGYIADATVFADSDNDGVLDAGEARTTTDATGNFTLVGGDGPLVMFGGTDVSTRLPFEGTLRAPEGATVITPLTTLIAELVDGGQSLTEATDHVASALGLSGLTVDGEPIDLLSFDPVLVAAGGGADGNAAAEVLAAGIQVQNAILQISAVLTGAGADDAGSAVVSELAALLATGTTVDLASATTIETLINDSADTSLDIDQADIANVAADAAAVVAASNGAIDTAMDSNATGVDLLTDLAQVAVVAQSGTVTDALEEAGESNDADVIDAGSFTDTLVDAIPNAVVGDVDGGQNGTPGNDTMVGTAGHDLMAGLVGNDVLFGLAGNDTLRGGAGNDTLDGGINADLLTPASFLDQDRVDYTTASGPVTVSLAAGSTGIGLDGDGGTDQLIGIEGVVGSAYGDTITGSNTFFEFYIGGAGNDTIDGGSLNDRAIYSAATSAITVNLGSGNINSPDGSGSVAGDSSVGNDTLAGIEQVRGTEYDDSYTVVGFISPSQVGEFSSTFNEFEGLGGHDTITGNGNTRVSYQNAQEAVTVNLVSATPVVGGSSGIAVGGASVGTDEFSGVVQVRGSAFADTMTGGTTTATQQFEGRGGDDSIDGGSGFDIARYAFDGPISVGLTINMAAGTVNGDPVLTGTDTLRSVESIQASILGDLYDATGYGAVGVLNVSNSNGNFNEFEGMAGNDTVIGNGNTRVNYISARGGVTVDLDSLNVTNASGVIVTNGVATVGGNVVVGSASGGASVGTDTIDGGVVQVRGSNFDDSLTGSNNAGPGNTFPYTEFFQGRAGNDTITGGGGFDQAVYNEDPTLTGITVDMNAINASTGTVVGDLWIGTDTLIGVSSVRGTNFADTYDATGFDSGIPGLGTFNEFEGGGGDDTITGANTRVSYLNAGSGVTVVLTAQGVGTADGGSTGHDTFIGASQVRGSNFNDTMTGSAGNDSFDGRGGNDSILGGSGNDALQGGDGDDTLVGGAGIDTLTGGNGIDQADYSGASVAMTVNLAAGTASDGLESDALAQMEQVRGSAFGDTIAGNGQANRFDGGGGNDTITGGGGADAFHGEAGNDSLVGGSANDYFEGGNDQDTLIGGGGNDTVLGGAGNDLMTGGIGADIVDSGGGGDSDTIVFNNINEAGDTVNSFSASPGGDVLKISDLLDASTTYADGSGGPLADFVQVVGSGSNGLLQIDTDGSAAGATWQTLATITGGSSLTLQILLNNNNILVT